MTDQYELYSVVVAVNVAVVAAVLFVLVPPDATLWLWPVFLLFLGALALYLRPGDNDGTGPGSGRRDENADN